MKTVPITVKGFFYPKKTSSTYIIVHCYCLLKQHPLFCGVYSIAQNIGQASFSSLLTLVIRLFLNILLNTNCSCCLNTNRIFKNNFYNFNPLTTATNNPKTFGDHYENLI